jgi:hypothetical protein
MTIDKEEREKNKELARRIVHAFNQKQNDETEEEYKERIKETFILDHNIYLRDDEITNIEREELYNE